MKELRGRGRREQQGKKTVKYPQVSQEVGGGGEGGRVRKVGGVSPERRVGAGSRKILEQHSGKSWEI